MVDVMTLEDTWYVPCPVSLKDASALDSYLRKCKRKGNYCISLFEGDFMFNDEERFVKVIRRRPYHGKSVEDLRMSKFLSDEDVMYILKCARVLGYKIILDVKYSN